MILIKRRLTALVTAATIGVSAVGLNMYSIISTVDAAGGTYDVSANVTAIPQKQGICWANSTQMMLNAKLTAEGIGSGRNRILGFSQDALTAVGSNTTEFEAAVATWNSTVPSGPSGAGYRIDMSNDDEKEQALIVYIGQKWNGYFQFKAESTSRMSPPAKAILNGSGLIEDKATAIEVDLPNEAAYRGALNLFIPFIKESLANGSPVAVNPDRSWKIIVGIDEVAETFKIQETHLEPIVSKPYKSVLYNPGFVKVGNTYPHTSLMGIVKSNSVAKNRYFVTGLDIGSNGKTVTLGPDGTAKVRVFVNDIYSDSGIKVTPLAGAPASGMSVSARSPIISEARIIAQGAGAVDPYQYLDINFTQPGQYRLEGNKGTKWGESFDITFTVLGLGTATPPTPVPNLEQNLNPTPTSDSSTAYVDLGNHSWSESSGFSGSSGSSGSSGPSGFSGSSKSSGASGSSSGTKSGSSNVSSLPVATSSVPTTTFVVPEAVSPMVDAVKAFTDLLNAKENKAIELKTSVSSWVFEAKDILKDTSKWVNFSTKVEVQPAEKTTVVPENIASVISGKNTLVVDFAKNGNLPGLARVSVKIGDAYKNKEMYAYYLYNDGKTTKFQLVSKDTKVDNNGYVRFAMAHGCNFVLVEKSVAMAIESRLATMEVK